MDGPVPKYITVLLVSKIQKLSLFIHQTLYRSCLMVGPFMNNKKLLIAGFESSHAKYVTNCAVTHNASFESSSVGLWPQQLLYLTNR